MTAKSPYSTDRVSPLPFSGTASTFVGLGCSNPVQVLRVAAGTRCPGLSMIILAIYTNCVICARPVLYQWGVSLPDAVFGIYGSTLTVALIAVGAYQYLTSGQVRWSCTKRHWLKIRLWFLAVAVFGFYGMLFGNETALVYREAYALFEMGVFLLLGADDRIWYGLEKHITVVFYLAVALILIYQQTPVPDIYAPGFRDATEPTNFRYSNTVAYLLRPLAGPGLLLGMWGLVRAGGGIWRIAQISALGLSFVCEVVIFKFRSEAVFIALAIVSFLLLRPLLERRLRPTIAVVVLSASVLGLGYYFETESWTLLDKRQTAEGGDMLRYRFEELEAYKADLGWKVMVGNGLGGSFDASTVREGEVGANRWVTLHFGLLVFTLKGGILLLTMFLSFVRPGISMRGRQWYANPYNLAAALLLPIYLIGFIVNPISLFPDSLWENLAAMMVLARFGARQSLVKNTITSRNWRQ